MSKKVMELLDPRTGEMECKVCGAWHWANYRGGGKFYRGSWHCRFGCKLDEDKSETKPIHLSKDDANRLRELGRAQYI